MHYLTQTPMKFISNLTNQKSLPVLLILYALFSAGLAAHLMNLSFFLLLVVVIARLIVQPGAGASFHQVYQSCKALHWSMAALLLALIVTQIAHGYFDLSPYNPIARLATFGLLLWLLQDLTLPQLRTMQWALIGGTVLCAIQLYLSPRVQNRPVIEAWYVELASLLGLLSVLSLGWNERPGKLSVMLHALGGLCGLYIAYLSQTRAIWIALPLFFLTAYLTFVTTPLKRKNIVLFLTGLLLFGIVFFNTDVARQRIQQAKQDVEIFTVNKNTDTSVGVRFQLWEASWIMIQEHPFIGVGTGDHYKAALMDMVNRRVLPTYYNGAHSHNEILFSTATMGIPGLIAILLTYLVPGYYFGKYLLDPDRQTRAAAAMGIGVCGGYLLFGLVDVLFKYKETEVLYCVSCALLFAFILNRKKQLDQTIAGS